ncbi:MULTISPECIES: restriction endonuclease subunit S [unclassified Fusobacterium]|uniref:restriction endonuclease subunit S n=1 Tax=unclassified Fusobacterium TaxID=2648384 RepID=UPI001B8AE6DD|nr:MULTISPECIES: restriction endonuclease subunit S [unclassified Fusobacterium]MBR8700194.1 hypothetical protein [Fusobacterium sp. DD45]MBR8710355.1 hypothetical protein [Fusobacterium sp. DD28]MBR8750916.1 hypothetical protein [Fusobacterium sp. DD26]
MSKKKTPAIRFKGFTDDWEQYKFEQLYKKINVKNDLSYTEQDIISVANMYYKTDTYISNKEYLKTYNVFKIGDIAFEGNKNKNFTHGRFVANTIGPGIISHVFDVFTPIMDYDLCFWKYAINNELIMRDILIRSTKSSTMMTNLVANDFMEEKMLVPCVPEQKQIGQTLQCIDNLITLHQRKCEKLKIFKKAMLEKMFPKNNKKIPEVRFKGFTDAWEQEQLGKLCEIYDGTHQTPKYTESGVMFLSVENIGKLKSNKFISEQDYKKNFKVFPEYGDVFMTRIGDIGTANVLQERQPIAYYVSLALLKPLYLDSFFLNECINSPSVKKELWHRTLHIAFPKKINKNEISKVLITYPTIIEQKKIGQYFKALDNLITLHQRKVEKLQIIKKSMLEKMFV